MLNTNDCIDETLDHRHKVQQCARVLEYELCDRLKVHDESKLETPEVEILTKVTSQLKALTYGSDEYKDQLKRLKPFTDHHYKHNRHHPEHFENGVDGMNLVDLLEMLCDWFAATKRHADGDIHKSIIHNAKRFNLDPQLVNILTNTVDDLDLDKPSVPDKLVDKCIIKAIESDEA